MLEVRSKQAVACGHVKLRTYAAKFLFTPENRSRLKYFPNLQLVERMAQDGEILLLGIQERRAATQQTLADNATAPSIEPSTAPE
jgi:hypothetical protein